MEESIKQLSEYLQLQISRMPIALVVWDTEFRVQSWNPAAEKMFGFSPAEALGKHPYDIIVPKEAQPHVDGIWRRLLEGDMTAHSINENITKDGRTIICDWANTPLKKDDATVLGVLSMVQDITERKQAEKRIEHLTSVLRAVRNVNQLITKEKDRDRLIQRACDLLVEKRSYEKSWILLLDENRNFVSAAGAGLEGSTSVFLEQLRSGNFPACVNTLLAQKQPFSAHRKERELCGSCVLASMKVDEGAFNCQLEYDGKLYGILGATVSATVVSDREEQDLFLELCGDIAFALADIEKTEKAHASERRYQTTVQTSMDGFLIADTKGRFVDVNDAYCRLLGYSREELLAMSLGDVEATEAREETALHIQRVVENGSDHFETKHRCRDGRIVNLDVSANYVSAEGLFFVFLRDITARKQAEKQIALLLDKESQAAREWQETFDAISDIVFQLSPSHEIRKINKAGCEATGKKLEDLIGKKCYNVVHGLNGPIRQCPCVEALKTKEVCASEYTEGGRYYLLTAYPIFDKGGKITSLTHIVKDITQQKKMQEQLVATDRLATIGQLASGIAHEMNNPLTGVIGFSEMLMKRTDLPDDAKEDLKIVNDEAQRTARVVKGLLTFARRQKAEKEPVDINSAIQNVLQLRSYEHRVSNIEVNTQLAPELPQVLGNSGQLQQVFINLVVNAEQAMLEAHNRGTLTIVTEQVGDTVKASVDDDGPGISPENIERLFTPFFTTKEVGKGTGLGLSICHGIVTEHGGKIYAESEPGKGATFVVELPIKK